MHFVVSLSRVKFHPSCSTFVPNILLMLLSFSLAHQGLNLRSWMFACWNLGETFCNLNLYLPWRAANTYQSTGGEFGMRWPTHACCTGSEIPGLGWKNLTQELQIRVVSWGGRHERGLVLKGLSSQGFRRHKADLLACAVPWLLTRYLYVHGLREAQGERLSSNGVTTELGLSQSLHLKLWGIERCTESSVVGWKKYMVKFSLKPSNMDSK